MNSKQKFIIVVTYDLMEIKKMLIHNKVGYTRKKQRRQLEREKLAKQHKTIKKPQKLETCHLTEL